MIFTDDKTHDVYLLPLFVENLRKEMGISQAELQEQYIVTLSEDIRQLSNNLVDQYKNFVDPNKIGQRLPGYNVTMKPRKKMIGFYGQLRQALEETTQRQFVMSDTQFEKLRQSINNSVGVFNDIVRSGGGVEIRKIRDILNPTRSPTRDKHDELVFILTHCFPKIFSHDKYFSPFRFDVLRCSPENTLFIYKGAPVKCRSVSKVIKTLNAVQRDPFIESSSMSPYNKEDARREIELKLVDIFKEVEQILTKEYKVEVVVPKYHNDFFDDYDFNPTSLGAAHAKSILYALSGLNQKAVDEKWDEISKSVYRIVVEAEKLSSSVYFENMNYYRSASRELLFVEEFILLFFSDSTIRKTVNSLSRNAL